MDSANKIPPLSCDEFCKPNERCFRGMFILFSMYAVGIYTWLLFITQLTNAHLDNHDPHITNPDHVKDNENIAKTVLFWSGNSFAILAVVGLLLMFKYRGVEGRQA